jgi:ATP-binding protein involved in chromosome partitioning
MDALATVTYAGTKKNLVESQMVTDQPAINGHQVKVVLEFPRYRPLSEVNRQGCRGSH